MIRARIDEQQQQQQLQQHHHLADGSGGGMGTPARAHPAGFVVATAGTAATATCCHYCEQEVSPKRLDEHMAACRMEVTWCENKCGRRIQRALMDSHADTECPKRLVPCSLCQKKFVFETLQMHQSNCPALLVSCPNRCGVKPMLREELDSHVQNFCPTAAVLCSFKDIGCTFKGTREELERHLLDSTVKHLNLACSVISRQRQETRALQAALNASENHTGELYWKISDFKARLADSRLGVGGGGGGKVAGGVQELVSAPFYTGPCGYKLVASVFPNGNGSGEGRYLSVYIKVLPGDYDHVLDWPFAVGLTFTLYDQCPRVGRVNISESFVPDPTWKHFQKPARDAAVGELPLGFGYPRFASHDELRTRSYLRDDSILIHIRAATATAPPR